MSEDHRQTFLEEAFELLSDLEEALLELEDSPSDMELIGRVFRALHTIKGSGAMFGFDDVSAFTHTIETVFDDVREGRLPVTDELITLTLKAKDIIGPMINGTLGNSGPLSGEKQVLIDSFRRIAEAKGPGENGAAAGRGPADAPEEGASSGDPGDPPATYRIRFKPSRDIFLSGTNPLLLIGELQFLGECRIFAGLDDVPCMDEMDPEQCYVSWDIILTTDKGINTINDVFIFLDEESKVDVTVIDRESPLTEKSVEKKLGEILVERHDVREDELLKTLSEKKKIGEMLVEKGLVSAEKVESALVEQQHLKEVRKTAQKTEEVASSIRVPAEKLDTLVNLVGELVTMQARLTQTAGLLNDGDLTLIAEEIERLTGDLRDNTLNIRMLPIGSTFGRFKRLVRDLSLEIGKEIELITEGAETELDKTVIEKLNDPLVHLIRNCIDHGIEKPEERLAAGKPGHGLISLSARHSGSFVFIEITDDGKGIDKEKVRRKAVDKGLLSPDSEVSDAELFAMIFMPGFSTSDTITSISGRGVGMDVVKRTIDSLRGQIEVESEKGTGTTIVLKIPLTLAIIDGLLVEVDKKFYVLPLSSVEECIELTNVQRDDNNDHRFVNLRGQLVPFIRLRESFDIAGGLPDIEQVVITGTNSMKIGIAVDQVIGGHQTVIKTLSRIYKDVDTVSGATILGDGTVALILDLARLVNTAEQTVAVGVRYSQ